MLTFFTLAAANLVCSMTGVGNGDGNKFSCIQNIHAMEECLIRSALKHITLIFHFLKMKTSPSSKLRDTWIQNLYCLF